MKYDHTTSTMSTDKSRRLWLKNINKNVEGKFQVKGIEILNYYFKTLECDSIYQMSHEGDFASLSYMEGFNPALHEKEMDILGKIVFAVANSKEG